MPGAHDELAADPPFAERATLVIAAVANRPESPLVQEHGDLLPVEFDGERDLRSQILAGAEAMPAGHEEAGAEMAG
jgi:hypothetical protein